MANGGGYLVLTRKVGEAIAIGDKLLTVESIDADDSAVLVEVAVTGAHATQWRGVGGVVAIGPGIEVHVSKLWRDKVRLAIKAPANVEIWRTEIAPGERRLAA